MAQIWAAKAPADVVERRWSPPLAADDSISSVSATGTGVTVDSDDFEGNEAVVILSAGSADTEASVTVTVNTSAGNTHVETFLIAIRATTEGFGNTVRDIANFALRKIAGMGDTADSIELDDAVELFNGMIATWRIDGMDVGIAGELTASDTVDVPDEFILPIKFCLRKLCHSTYEAQLTATDELMAAQGERLIANTLFKVPDLAVPHMLSGRSPWAQELN